MATQINLDYATLRLYRAAFNHAVNQGLRKPLVIPYSLLGAFIVPTLWLTIPHTQRPWLYATRWAVVAFIVVFNIQVCLETSSTNIACSYATGLIGSWGIIYTLHLLVWTRPQFDAARIVRRSASSRTSGADGFSKPELQPNRDLADQAGMRQRLYTKSISRDGHPRHDERPREYVWQPFPTSGPFLERLNWALDLTTSFRGAGWSWAISSIPRPPVSYKPRSDAVVDLSAMPRVSKSGYYRCLTEKDFVLDRFLIIGGMYMVLDALKICMMEDPYFILGPDTDFETPIHLQRFHPWIVCTYREILSLVAFISAIVGIFNLSSLVSYYCLRYIFPMRGDLWQYPSIFGSFLPVLDHGLAGWWGSWWHQTFRAQFLAPATWLLKRGYLTKGTTPSTLAALTISFAQSAFLHASGSISSIPDTRPWRSLVFFLVQPIGIVAQQSLLRLATERFPALPLGVRRTVNLVLTLVWLWLTGQFFVDDIASTGLWLFEPVPISPLRLLGFGRPGDHWWRWDRDCFPKWHVGAHRWQSGIAL